MGKGRWEWTLIEIEMFTPALNETSADALMISNCPFSIARKHFQHPPKRSFIHWWGGKRWSFPFSFHRLPVLPAWPNIKEDLRTPWVSWLWANIMSLLSRGWGGVTFYPLFRRLFRSLEIFDWAFRFLRILCASDIDVSAAEVGSELNPPEPPALNGTQIWGRGQSSKVQRRKKWKQTS